MLQMRLFPHLPSAALRPAIIRRAFFLLALAGAAQGAAAQTVTLTANPTTGSAPLPVSLTWSSTGAGTCTASGAWSGAKALSGSETVTVSANSTFTLVCAAATGSARVSWTAPTANTDGSALTNLAGFRVFHAATSAGVATATAIDVPGATATSYTITGLPAGVRYYAARAYNSAGGVSDLSAIASNTVVLASAQAQASVTVAPRPLPPTLVTVAQVAYEIGMSGGTVRLGRAVGSIALGVACLPEPIVTNYAGSYYAVPLEAVRITKPPKSSTLVVLCAAG